MCAKGYNLPDNVSPNDPDAPWNKTEEPEPEIGEEIELVCINESCGWEGSIEAAATNAEGEYLCPVCGGQTADVEADEEEEDEEVLED